LTPLSAWRNPVVAANTATSDFHLADFLRATARVSLYLIVSPADDLLIRTPLRLFLNQLVRRLTEAGGLGPARLTLLLDEFPFFGRMDFFLQHLSVLGGYGIRTVLAAQNVPQLAALYGHADRLIEQCRVRVYGAAQGMTTGGMISQQTGTTTATTAQHAYRRDRFALLAGGTTVNEQQHGRPLLLASEAAQIPERRLVIQVSGHPSVWARKVRFWRHRVWRQRSQLLVPGPVGRRQETGHERP
jgi:type IV secretion system protein VirD4